MTTDWLEFDDPTDDFGWRVDLSFFVSNWKCIFGQGCPGLFGVHETRTDPDAGCCGLGAHLNTRDEYERVLGAVEGLTEQDLDPEGLAYIRKHGWAVVRRDDGESDDVHIQTRVRDGLCVFSNRSNESGGRMGCAFAHRAARLGIGHREAGMPDVCWQLPIARRSTYHPDTGRRIYVLTMWDETTWGGDPEHTDEHMAWWCTTHPDAYVASSPVYERLETELRDIMGNDAYDRLRALIVERAGNVIAPTSGQTRNGGVKSLPLLVNHRTARRSSS